MARWGSGGKLANVGLSQPGLLGATAKQYATLKRLDRRQYTGLTKEAASELIQKAYERIAKERAGLTTHEDKYIEALWQKAIRDANQAGEAWLEQNQDVKFVVLDEESNTPIGVHGTIGKAWLTWPPRRTPFYKWLMENYYEPDMDRKTINLPHRYDGRLELGLQLACQMAAFRTFRLQGMNLGEVKLMTQSDAEPVWAQAA